MKFVILPSLVVVVLVSLHVFPTTRATTPDDVLLDSEECFPFLDNIQNKMEATLMITTSDEVILDSVCNKTAPPVVQSPYYYVDREETIRFDDLCNTGGVPVMFAIATLAIIFFATQYFYQLQLGIMTEDAMKKDLAKESSVTAAEEQQEKKKKKKEIILLKSLTNGGYLEEIFLAPFVPSSMETLASSVFFIWFLVTASFGVSRLNKGKWINENTVEQYPFNILSFLVGCPGLDPYDVTYTKSWKEAPPTADDENPFDSSIGMLVSKWGIAAIVTLSAVLLPLAKTIKRRTLLILAASSGLVFSIYHLKYAENTKTAGLLAFEFFFSRHWLFGLAWLCFGFYQIYHARHGWSYKSAPTDSATDQEEVAADKSEARYAAHRLFGRVVAVPSLAVHLLMSFLMACRNPANQLKPMRMNYFLTVFASFIGGLWGIYHAVLAREKQADIDEKEAEIEDMQTKLKDRKVPEKRKGVLQKEIHELRNEIYEASKLRDFNRMQHVVKMFMTWILSLAGSGSVRIAIWILWTTSKFFEPELRKNIDRGYCIDSAYNEGDTQDVGDSSTCLAPVYLNILLMGVIINWVNWAFLRTDTVQDARAKYKKDYEVEDCFKGEKDLTVGNMKWSINGTLGFIIIVFVLKLKQDKIELYIYLFDSARVLWNFVMVFKNSRLQVTNHNYSVRQ